MFSIVSTESDSTFLKPALSAPQKKSSKKPMPQKPPSSVEADQEMNLTQSEDHNAIRGLHPDIGLLDHRYHSGIRRAKHKRGGETLQSGSKCGGHAYEQLLVKARRDVTEPIETLRKFAAIDVTDYFPSAHKKKSKARLAIGSFAGIHPQEAAHLADQALEALQLIISQVDISIRALQLGAKLYGNDMIYDWNTPGGDANKKRKPQTIARLNMNNGLIDWGRTRFDEAAKKEGNNVIRLTRNKKDGKHHAADIARLTCRDGYEFIRELNIPVSKLNHHATTLRSLRLNMATYLTRAQVHQNSVGSTESAYDIGPLPEKAYVRQPKK